MKPRHGLDKPTPEPMTVPAYTPPPAVTYVPTVSTQPDDSACLSQKSSSLASIQSQESSVQQEINQETAQIEGSAGGSMVTESQLEEQIANATASYRSQLSGLQEQYDQEELVSC